jgi:hypothetical protein
VLAQAGWGAITVPVVPSLATGVRFRVPATTAAAGVRRQGPGGRPTRRHRRPLHAVRPRLARRPSLSAASLTPGEGWQDCYVVLPCSAKFVRDGDELGSAQRLAVMAADFSRWSKRSFADTPESRRIRGTLAR